MTDTATNTSMGQSAPVRVLGIGGSLRPGSRSLGVLRTALALAEGAGACSVLADVRTLQLPVYDPGLPLDAYPPSLPWLLQEVRAAEAYILCSPTYHGTVSSAVKNVLDALDFLGQDRPPYLGGKVVGLIALGGDPANTLNSLHHATRALNGLTAPRVVGVTGAALDSTTGEVLSGRALERLQRMVGEVMDLTRRLRD